MWPFRRKKEDLGSVPAEVQEYYQAEQRERAGVAWALAFVTLAVTVGIVLGAFFGGRAIYRNVTHKNKTAVTQPKPVATSTATQSPKSSSTSTNTSKTTTPSTPSTSTPSTPTPPAPASSDTSKNVASTPPPATPSNPPTSNQQTITNTGPAGTAAAFVGATVLGAVLYQLHLRRKLVR